MSIPCSNQERAQRLSSLCGRNMYAKCVANTRPMVIPSQFHTGKPSVARKTITNIEHTNMPRTVDRGSISRPFIIHLFSTTRIASYPGSPRNWSAISAQRIKRRIGLKLLFRAEPVADCEKAHGRLSSSARSGYSCWSCCSNSPRQHHQVQLSLYAHTLAPSFHRKAS